jgi:hypothetical protein
MRIPVFILVRLWALPTSCLGLLVVPLALLSGGGIQIVNGVLEVHGGLARGLLERCTPLKGGALAMTLGHVVIGRDMASLAQTRRHERVHVRQCERWGPLFLPAYLLASAWILVFRRGRSPYLDNCFEREARRLAP